MNNEDFLKICTPETYERIGELAKTKQKACSRKLNTVNLNMPGVEKLTWSSVNPKALAQYQSKSKTLYMDNEGIMSTMTNIYETASLDAEWVAYDGLELVCLNGGEITVRTNKALLYAQDGVTFEQDCWLPISQIRYFKAEEMSGAELIELKNNEEIVKFWEEKGSTHSFYLPIEKIYIPRWLASQKFGKEEMLKLGDKSLFKKIESLGENFFDDLDI